MFARLIRNLTWWKHKGRHAAAMADGRGYRRKVLGLPLVLILMVASVAVALFLLQRGFSGSVEGAIYELNLTAAYTPGGHEGACVPTADLPANEVNLTWSGAIEGETCNVVGDYSAPATNTNGLRLQSFTAPAGLVAYFGDSEQCGKTWAPGELKGMWAELEFDGTVTSITFDPSVHGPQWVRTSEFNAGLCNPVAP